MAENFFDEQSEQSQIKAAIVTDYFWQWAGFMVGQQNKFPRLGSKLQYIDLFAGPGRYENGAKSTPLFILETTIQDEDLRGALVTIFNDKDEENTSSLIEEVEKLKGIDKLKHKPQIEAYEALCSELM